MGYLMILVPFFGSDPITCTISYMITFDHSLFSASLISFFFLFSEQDLFFPLIIDSKMFSERFSLSETMRIEHTQVLVESARPLQPIWIFFFWVLIFLAENLYASLTNMAQDWVLHIPLRIPKQNWDTELAVPNNL